MEPIKRQQAVRKLTTPAKTVIKTPIDLPQDSVTLGTHTKQLRNQILIKFQRYKGSNSRTEQANIRREIEADFDHLGGDHKSKAMMDKLNGLLTKNENAWSSRERGSQGSVQSSVEWNFTRLELSQGQPLTADSLFQVDQVKDQRNRLKFADRPLGDALDDEIEDAENFMSPKPQFLEIPQNL